MAINRTCDICGNKIDSSIYFDLTMQRKDMDGNLYYDGSEYKLDLCRSCYNSVKFFIEYTKKESCEDGED